MNRTRCALVAGKRQRHLLFLQGNSSPFFWELGKYLAASGASISRIAFCAGDLLFWPPLAQKAYQGAFWHWHRFLDDYVRRHGVTDIVLFGDSRPYHRVAINYARINGIQTHIFDEGYIRPHWITIERHGSNANSDLPRDADELLSVASLVNTQESARQVAGGFGARVVWDVAHHIFAVGLSPLFPHYRRHRPHHPLHEAVGWSRRWIRRALSTSTQVTALGETKLFLFPLQLDSDYQVRRHSGLGSVSASIEAVLGSFSRYAPSEARLVVKLHPLDNGLVDHKAHVARLSKALGMADRVTFIDGGDLGTLIKRAAGIVVINSTTGLTALHHGRPVITLGKAIYDIEGLTFRDGLDRFWLEAQPPNATLVAALFRVLARTSQVNGSYFVKHGRRIAIETIANRWNISGETSAADDAGAAVAVAAE